MNALLIIILVVLIVSLLCIAWYIEQRLREFECRMENQAWLRLDKLDVNATISFDGRELKYTVDSTVTAHNLTAKYVEHWLDQRGLVMAPKGQDFKVKARAES